MSCCTKHIHTINYYRQRGTGIVLLYCLNWKGWCPTTDTPHISPAGARSFFQRGGARMKIRGAGHGGANVKIRRAVQGGAGQKKRKSTDPHSGGDFRADRTEQGGSAECCAFKL